MKFQAKGLKAVTTKVVKAIQVTNQSLPIDIFNNLCDELSRLRHYCHDYRIWHDFNPAIHNRYWQSTTYLDSETMLIDATYQAVSVTIKKFCKQHDFQETSVLVEIKTYTLD